MYHRLKTYYTLAKNNRQVRFRFSLQQQNYQISLRVRPWRVSDLFFSADSTSMRARTAQEIVDKLWHNLSNSTKSADTRRVDLAFEVSDSFFPSNESYLYGLTKEKERKEQKKEQ